MTKSEYIFPSPPQPNELESFIITTVIPQLGYGSRLAVQTLELPPRHGDFLRMTRKQLQVVWPHSQCIIWMLASQDALSDKSSLLRRMLQQLDIQYGLMLNGQKARLYRKGSRQPSYACTTSSLGRVDSSLSGLIGKWVLDARFPVATQTAVEPITEYPEPPSAQLPTAPVEPVAESLPEVVTLSPAPSSQPELPPEEVRPPSPEPLLVSSAAPVPEVLLTTLSQKAERQRLQDIAQEDNLEPKPLTTGNISISPEQATHILFEGHQVVGGLSEEPKIEHKSTTKVAFTTQSIGGVVMPAKANKPESPKESKGTLKADNAVTAKSVHEAKKEGRMVTIAVYHNKGGVGKTTVSTNLAAGLRRRGHRVLLVDIDAQANATYATGLIKFENEEDDYLRGNNVFQVIYSEEQFPILEVAQNSVDFNKKEEIKVLPAHLELIEKHHHLDSSAAAPYHLLLKLEDIGDQLDYIIIDVPPSRDVYAQTALITADYVIIPSDLRAFANQGLPIVLNFMRLTNNARRLAKRPQSSLLGILPSKISTHTSSKKRLPDLKERVAQRYGVPIMDTEIFERTALGQASGNMIEVDGIELPDPKSIFAFAPRSEAAQEFDNLVNEVLHKATPKGVVV